MIPSWLHGLAIASLMAGFVSAGIIVVDELRRPQAMWIMNLVWPITALFGSLAILWAYFHLSPREEEKPNFATSVAKGCLHCGAGCTLGDILAEFLALGFPWVLVLFGWQSLFQERMFAAWGLDFLFAFMIGIAFQYFAIKPARGLSVREGLIQAIQADALSLSAWQIGMYGVMAFGILFAFPTLFSVRLTAADPEFWMTMQIAMFAGFLTSYPVNWWLIRTGIKERM